MRQSAKHHTNRYGHVVDVLKADKVQYTYSPGTMLPGAYKWKITEQVPDTALELIAEGVE